MSFFNDMLHTVGETFDDIGGVAATLVRGERKLSITCVPVKKPPTYLAEHVAVTADVQDFYLFRKQLGDFYPRMDDRIEINGEVYQISATTRFREVIPPVEPLASDGDRIVVHTVRIRNDRSK
ncbi:MAG: hypothetical protein IJK97_05070 [Thermoguttaceae bacterium]|nr:hypothetical protein [Thermoguttaceae bacterium]MBQ9454826.1 hypothetical protein [Thermoguttaceae bacterium]